MPVDRWELLAWMAEREDNEPGRPTIDGNALMQEASRLAGDDNIPRNEVARAAAHLERSGYIQWLYEPWSNDPPEPRTEFIGEQLFQRMREIGVTAHGRTELAQRQAKEGGTQINIVNSTVGQLALGDISNVDIFVILNAAERSLDGLDAAEEVKDEARGAIRQMRETGTSILSAAASEILATAVRRGLGLP